MKNAHLTIGRNKNNMKYWDKVKVTSWFYEWQEFIIVNYCRWRQTNDTYKMCEVSYNMNIPTWWLIPLLPEQKMYELYDEKLWRIIKWPDDWWFLESNLELTK